MKTIYLVDNKEVKLGDFMELGGASVPITQELIDGNPKMFEVKEDIPEYVECTHANGDHGVHFNVGEIYLYSGHSCSYDTIDGLKVYREPTPHIHVNFSKHTGFKPSTKEAYERQELLKEAKKRYPIGTKFKAVDYKVGEVVEVVGCFDLTPEPYCKTIGGNVGYRRLQVDGKWAEIVKPIFTCDDGVDIYEGDEYWITPSLENILYCQFDDKYPRIQTDRCVHYENNSKWLVFSTKEAAEVWVDENRPKEKTLEDCESELLKYTTELENNNTIIDNDDFFSIMKMYEPKLYWTKVLQLIADGFDEVSYSDKYHYIMWIKAGDRYIASEEMPYNKFGAVGFFSVESASKAIEIMGDKLDCIYK